MYSKFPLVEKIGRGPLPCNLESLKPLPLPKQYVEVFGQQCLTSFTVGISMWKQCFQFP